MVSNSASGASDTDRKGAKSLMIIAAILAAAAGGVIVSPARAVTLTWDGGDATFGAPTGGTGTWDTATTPNWTGAALPDVQWTDTTGVDTALFTATAGTVTVISNTANKLQFNSNSFTLSSGSLTLAGTTPTIAFGTTTGQVINSIVTGSNLTFTAGSGGFLALNGNNASLTGTTTLNLSSGTIGITSPNNASNVTVSNGFGASAMKFTSNGTVNYRANGDGTTAAQSLNYGNNVELNGGNATFNVGRNGSSSSDNKTFAFGTLTFSTASTFTFAGAIGSGPADRISFSSVVLGANGTLSLGSAVSGVGIVGAISESVAGKNFTLGTPTGTGGTILMVSGASSYTGTTNIQHGTLRVGINNALPAGTTLTLGTTGGTATLDLNGFNQTVAGLATVGTAMSQSITNSSATANATFTFSGSGSFTFGGVIKEGTRKTALVVSSGTLTLSATNTYSGGTAVIGGTLITASTGGTLGTGNVSVANSGTVIELDNPNSIKDTASLTLGNGTKIFLNFSDASGTEQVGGLTVDGTSFAVGTVFKSGQLNGVDGSYFQFQAGTNEGSLTVVPEPGSAGLMVAGVVGLAARRRRRNSRTDFQQELSCEN